MTIATIEGIRIRTLLLCLAGGVLAAGCSSRILPTIGGPLSENGLGHPCQVSSTPTPPTSLAVNPTALECGSGVCLLPAQEVTTNTGPLCTDGCVTDDDCLGGQRRDPRLPADLRCLNGFACRALIPNVESVPFACQRLCVCKDFLPNGSTDVPPTGCL
jgi:hypothetical protein